MQKSKFNRKIQKSKGMVNLKCAENNKILKAQMIDHTPAYMMVCMVDNKVRISLRYNSAEKKYLGKVGTLEFSSDGPE